MIFRDVCRLQTGSMSGMMPSLVRLNSSDSNLWNDLKQLDCLSVRTADTVYLFYVKAGQSKLTDILQNVVSSFALISSWISYTLSEMHRVLYSLRINGHKMHQNYVVEPLLTEEM